MSDSVTNDLIHLYHSEGLNAGGYRLAVVVIELQKEN